MILLIILTRGTKNRSRWIHYVRENFQYYEIAFTKKKVTLSTSSIITLLKLVLRDTYFPIDLFDAFTVIASANIVAK